MMMRRFCLSAWPVIARRNLLFVALLVLSVPGVVRAQLSVDCELKNRMLVQYEPIIITLKCRNDTGRELTLGGKDSEVALGLELLQTPNYPILPRSPFILETPVELEPHRIVEVELDVKDYYDLPGTGPYAVRASLNWEGYSYTTGKSYLDIVPGLEIASQVARTLDGSGMNQFTLLTLHRNQGNHLFVRLDDKTNGGCLGVHHLGRVMLGYTPQLQADATANVHILHMSGPGVFTHTTFSAAGEPLSQTLHESQGTANLRAAPGGRLVVKATRPPADRIRSFDLPERKKEP
jgi:hypothetical protein